MLCLQSKQEAEHKDRDAALKSSSMPASPEQDSSKQLPSSSMSAGDASKGPRRRNKAERAALQQEQDLADQQKAKRRFRW